VIASVKNRKPPARKAVAYVSYSGKIYLPRQRCDGTFYESAGYVGLGGRIIAESAYKWVELEGLQEFIAVYEGDEVTLQF
jgi:hypothetical protein